MKTFTKISLLSIFISSLGFAQGYDDDIYYSPKDEKKVVPQERPMQPQATTPPAEPATEPDYVRTTTEMDEEGNTFVTNNYYGDYYEDDYYDYQYTSRIRRFHQRSSWAYYDPWFTDYYWYSYDPWYYGTSIYMSYNWWGPSWGWNAGWNTGWNVGWGWGWGPRRAYVYDPWFGGYYGNNWGWGGYGRGYRNGYRNGYWDGYYNGMYDGFYGGGSCVSNYYNSFDRNSYYYGSRNTVNSNGQVQPRQSFQSKYENTVMNNDRNRTNFNTSSTGVSMPNAEGLREVKSPTMSVSPAQKSTAAPNTNMKNSSERATLPTNANYEKSTSDHKLVDTYKSNKNTQPNMEYQKGSSTRPANTEFKTTTPTREVKESTAPTYKSNDYRRSDDYYRQPAKKEYSAPSKEYKSTTPYKSNDSYSAPKREYKQPSNNYQKSPKQYNSTPKKSYSKPNNSYSAPKKSPSNYSKPKSYSAPKRSYSAPSRSYTPSRSNSGGSRSSTPSRSSRSPR